MTKTRHLEAVDKIFEELRISSYLENYTFINSIEKDKVKALSVEEKSKITSIISNYNRMAFFVKNIAVISHLVPKTG